MALEWRWYVNSKVPADLTAFGISLSQFAWSVVWKIRNSSWYEGMMKRWYPNSINNAFHILILYGKVDKNAKKKLFL